MSDILITSPLRGLRKNFPSAWRSCILLSALAFYLGFLYWVIPAAIPKSLDLLAPHMHQLDICLMVVGAAGASAYLFKPRFGYSWLIGALYCQWAVYASLAVTAIVAATKNGGGGYAGAGQDLVFALWSLDTAVDVTKLRRVLLGVAHPTKSGPSRNRTVAPGTSRRRSTN